MQIILLYTRKSTDRSDSSCDALRLLLNVVFRSLYLLLAEHRTAAWLVRRLALRLLLGTFLCNLRYQRDRPDRGNINPWLGYQRLCTVTRV